MPERDDGPPPLRIDLLYFEGCPSYKTAWSDLLDALTETGIDARIRPIHIDSPERADALGFAGSPSITIEGRDLEGYRGPGVMACRVYRENGNRGWPSRALLRRKLREASTLARSDGANDQDLRRS